MIRAFRLLLPVLFPSWRFFAEVGPSPRIEWRRIEGPCHGPWRPVFIWPERISGAAQIKRLFFNPAWNAQLYLVTCAEKLAEEGCPAAANAVVARLGISLGQTVQLRVLDVEPGLKEPKINLVYQSGTLRSGDAG